MSDESAILAKLVRLTETLVAEVATLKGYAEKHEAAVASIDHRIENLANGIFALSKDLNDVRTSVLGPSAKPPAIEHERIDRLSERAR